MKERIQQFLRKDIWLRETNESLFEKYIITQKWVGDILHLAYEGTCIRRERELRLLSGVGNTYPKLFLCSLFEGKEPMAVFLEEGNGVVWVLLQDKRGTYLEVYGKVTFHDSTYLEDLNLAMPYDWDIPNHMLVGYIARENGLKDLRREMTLRLDCGVKVQVKKGAVCKSR